MTLATLWGVIWGLLFFQSLPMGGIPARTKATPTISNHSNNITTGTSCGGSVTSCTITSAVVGATGDAVYAVIGTCFNSSCGPGSACTVSVSDGTNTYTARPNASAPYDASNSRGVMVFVASNATAGTRTMTFSISGTGCTFNFSTAMYVDVAGVLASPIDTAVESQNSSSTGVTSFTLTSGGNVASVNELAIVSSYCWSVNNSSEGSTNFTKIETATGLYAQDFNLNAPTSGSTVSFNGTCVSSSAWSAGMLALRAN